MRNQAAVVDVKNLTFKRAQRIIFDKISLQIMPGKITAIMGPSGTGKTTLLRLIGGELFPDSGEVSVFSNNIHQLSRGALFKLRKRMGILFQNGALFTDMTAIDNVKFPLQEHTDLPESMIHDLALCRLESVGLRGAANLSVSELSGGMARRVALARAMVMDPEFIMYDEPFTGQDPITRGVLVELIQQLNDSLGLTSILVSHDIEEAMGIADYVYVIAGGKVIGEGSPSELQASDDPYVVQFLQGKPDGPVAFRHPAPDLSEDLGIVVAHNHKEEM